MPTSGLRAEKAVEQGMRLGAVGEILVDRDFGQVGTEHVGAGLQDDGDQRNHDLPACRDAGRSAGASSAGCRMPCLVRLLREPCADMIVAKVLN